MGRTTCSIIVGCLLIAGCGGTTGGGGGGRASDMTGLDNLGDPTADQEAGQLLPGECVPPDPQGPFNLFLSSDRTRLIRGDDNEGVTTITAEASSRAAFEWSVDAPEGLVTMGPPGDVLRCNTIVGSQIELTALGDPGPDGTGVRVSVTSTQVATGVTETETMTIELVRPEGALTVAASADKTEVPPGEAVRLVARVSGGEPFAGGVIGQNCEGSSNTSPLDPAPPYQVTWQFNDTALETEEGSTPELLVHCLTADDDVTLSEATFTAPIGSGTVFFTVEARDATGNRVTGSVTVTVAPEKELTVAEASSESTTVAPGDAVLLTARGTGGEAPYEIRFMASGSVPDANITRVEGGEQLTRELTSGCSNVAEDGECVVEYAAPEDQEGSELITVEITDRLGSTSAATIPLILSSETGLQVAGISDDVRVDPAGQTTITAIITGGTPPYTVVFDKRLEGSNLTAPGLETISNCGDTQADGFRDIMPDPQDPTSASASITYVAPLALDSEVVTIVVCDNVGNSATTTVLLAIDSAEALSVSAAGIGSRVQPNSTTPISATVVGGTPPYTVCFAAEHGTLAPGVPGCGPIESLTNCTCNLGAAGGTGFDLVEVQRDYTAPAFKTAENVSVRVRDAVGTEATDAVLLEVASDAGGGGGGGGGGGAGTISLTLSVSDSTPCLGETVTLTATTTGGSGGNVFTWDIQGAPLAGESLASAGSTATYTAPSATSGTRTIVVTVTEQGGSSDTKSTDLVVAPDPDCTVSALDVCPASTGNTASIPDAGAGATYTWTVTGGTITAGDGTREITYDADPGSTDITLDVDVVTDNGCTNSCTKLVSVNANPTTTITLDAEVCAGSTGNTASVADAGAGAAYVWDITPGSTITAGQGTPAITYTAGNGATLEVDVDITTASGCSLSSSETVTINTNPVATITADASVCAAATGHTASVPDAGPGATYDWTISGGTITAGNGTDTITYTSGSGLTVDLGVTVIDANGCSSSDAAIIPVNSNPDATILADSAVCDGSTGHTASVADAGAGATYAWTVTGGTITAGDGTSSITYTAGSGVSLSIDVTVTDSNGCVDSDSVLVLVDLNPICTITADTAVCAGSSGHQASVTNAGPGASYIWSVTGGTIAVGQNSPVITYTAGSGASLDIDVTITDGNGCTCTDSVTVTVDANPDATVTADAEVCADTAGNTASVPDAGVGASYAWSLSGGSITAGQGTDTITYTAGSGGSVTIDVTVVDGNGCSASDGALVSINANPNASISTLAEVCDGTTGNVASVADAGAGATYVWSIAGASITAGDGTREITYTAGAGPDVDIDVVVTTADGCTDSDAVVVSVVANPTTVITADAVVCSGSTGNIASVPSAGLFATYDWVVTGGTITAGFTDRVMEYTAGTGATVSIDVTVANQSGCVSLGHTDVTIQQPDCTLTADAAVCEGSTGNTASVPDAGVGASYTWNITGGTITAGDGTDTITYTAGSGATVEIDVTVTDGDGCECTDSVSVTVDPNPDCTITADAAVCEDSTGNTASVLDAGVGASYVWGITGGTITAGDGTDTITYTAGSGATVELDVTITDADGCECSDSVSVAVDPNPDCTITADAAVCEDSAGNIASVPDAGVGASYVWGITGGTITAGDGTDTITYTAGSGATVDLDVTITDANGCECTDSVSVTVDPDPDCTITADAAVCEDSTGNIASVPDAGVGASYVWGITGGTITAGNGTDTITYTAGSGATVDLDVTITDANGCECTDSVSVTVDPAPDCTITADASVPTGSTGNLASVPDAGVGATYVWAITGGTITAGDGTDTITYTAGAGPTVDIDVTVTDSAGCECSDSVSIPVT